MQNKADKITKRFLIATPYSTSHLMQIRQTKIIGIIDENQAYSHLIHFR
jgi:hypothetical protein